MDQWGGFVHQMWSKMTTKTDDETHEKIVPDDGHVSRDDEKSFAGTINEDKNMMNHLTNATDAAKKKSAKAQLHELCAKRKWKQPVYECCNDEGPAHQKLFTFMILVEIKEETAILECFGNPRPSKKAAAEDAAEGALWCLKHMDSSAN